MAITVFSDEEWSRFADAIGRPAWTADERFASQQSRWENQDALGVQTDAYAKVISVRPCLRTGVDGFVLRETVAE